MRVQVFCFLFVSRFPSDVDECSFEEHCRRELGNVCVNTPGSFRCQCQAGFRAEAPACVGTSPGAGSAARKEGAALCHDGRGLCLCSYCVKMWMPWLGLRLGWITVL